MGLSVELLEALRDCIETIRKLVNQLQNDREDMPDCVNGEILQEYLRGVEGSRELAASLLSDLQAILEKG